MQRKAFDKITSGIGAALVVVLLIAGGLLTWAYSFAQSSVKTQLAQQDISFPTQKQFNQIETLLKGGPAAVKLGGTSAGGQASVNAATGTVSIAGEFPNAAQQVQHLEGYAGQKLSNGSMANAYATWYIGQHLYAMPFHGIYSQISAASMSGQPAKWKGQTISPSALSSLENTTFTGTTLRGMLLTAYAFGTIGVITFWASLASWAGAIALLILTILGYWHASKTSEDEPLFRRRIEAEIANNAKSTIPETAATVA